jgi:hypothetical protein
MAASLGSRLGKLAKGVKKKLSPEERKRRSDWMKKIRRKGLDDKKAVC